MATPSSEQSLFLHALGLPSPADRAAYLDEVCRDNPTLRAELEALLAAHDRLEGETPQSRREQSAADPHATAAFLQERQESASLHNHVGPEGPGTVLGNYKLLEQIGEGGMGTVWMAQQTAPIKRLVALKLVKAGMDSRAVLARFDAERQALALMDHPNIAKVFDAGAIQAGDGRPEAGGQHSSLQPPLSSLRPFFVMELVKGIPITKFCDEKHLTPRQRLELFVPVCHAIQHAHHKGIIHRDIKPNNVLVALYDDKPVPKVIDFGVAKAVGQPLTEQSLHTGFGQVVGTLEYMSPEQASFNQLDVDTRSDIYSLGVLLYELLAGSPPFSRKELEEAGVLEMLRVIREQEPQKPSTKLSTAEGLPSLAANRSTEPKRLTALVRGELDWIVMKALEKDRIRRYETANGLAMDLQRYLADEPVFAGPPSTRYRLRKFIRRNKGPVLAATLVILALIGGMVGTTFGLVQAEQRREEAEQARQNEGLQRNAAEANARKALAAAAEEKKAKEQAQKSLTQVEKGIDLLGSVFGELDPKAEEKEGKPLRALLGERLDRATHELEGDAIGDPLAVAKLQMTLGYSQLGLGNWEKAITLFTKARATFTTRLGRDHPDTLTSMNRLALAYKEAGKLDLALALSDETLNLTKATLGPDHPNTLTRMNNLASAYAAVGKFNRALPLWEETYRRTKAKQGATHLDTLISMHNLAFGYQQVGKFAQALPLYAENFKLRKAQFGPDHPSTLISMANLADAYRAAGKLSLGLPLLEETLQRRKTVLGPDHPYTLASMNSLALGYRTAGKLDLALPLFDQTLGLRKVRLGLDHPDTLISMSNLALGYLDAGKLDLALPLFEETLKLMRAKLGPHHPDTLNGMNNLGHAYFEASKFDLALPLWEETLQLRKGKLGPDHPDTLVSMNNLAVGYQTVGKLDLALPLLEETLQLTKAKLGPDHPLTLQCMNNLAVAYLESQKFDLALPLCEETLKLRKAKLGRDHPDTLTSMNNLAWCYEHVGKLDQALALYEETIKCMKVKLGPEHPSLLNCMNNLAALLGRMKKLDRSIPLFVEVLALRRRKLGEDNPETLKTLGQLATNYRDAGRTPEATALHKDALASARRQWKSDSPEMVAALVETGAQLLDLRAFADAEPVLKECLFLRQKAEPDAWTTYNTTSMLGGALLGQKKYAESEPLLVKGYEGLKQREATIPAQAKVRLIEALEWLVQLHEAVGKKDEAAKWRKELEMHKQKESGIRGQKSEKKP